MDQARRNEIAYALFRLERKKNGYNVDQNFRRRIGNIAKQIGVPFAELLEFSTILAKELLEEVSDTKTPPTEEELKGFRGRDFDYDGHGH